MEGDATETAQSQLLGRQSNDHDWRHWLWKNDDNESISDVNHTQEKKEHTCVEL